MNNSIRLNIFSRLRKLVVVTILLLTSQLSIASVSGNWVITVDLGQYAHGDAKLRLSEETEGKLSGTYVGEMLNGPFVGSYDNEGFEFAFDSNMGMYFTFKGQLHENGKIEGTVESMGRVFGSFSGQKSE